MTSKKRTDIYNIKVLAEKVGTPNAYQKLNFLFKGVNLLADKDTVKKAISVLKSEHKATIKFLESLNHPTPTDGKDIQNRSFRDNKK